MTAAAVVLAALVGLIVGSFLTVVTSRVPAGLSITAPRSRCPICATPIRPADNVPLVSYVLCRGRCRSCRAHISVRYPATELATAVLFGLTAARATTLWVVPAYCVLAAGLVALTVIDLELMRLPTAIIAATGLIGAPLLVLASVATRDDAALLRVLVAGAAGFALFGAIFLAAPRGMGFGDVRLAALCGGFLGWLGYRVATVGLLASFVLAGVIALALIAAGRAGRKTRLPFGPFLAVGTLVAVFYGVPIGRVWLG